MRDRPPALYARALRKLTGLRLLPTYRRYRSMIGGSHPFREMPIRFVGDASADPTEFFDHYDAFSFWAARKLEGHGRRLAILDVGSIKMMNAILSVQHDVTALVLQDCGDALSNVRYVRHDVSDPLPFADASFDVFTSMASLQLAGLGRYGDRLNPDCLPNLVAELNRVMRPSAMLLVSMCLGKNALNFNNSWFFDLETLTRIFHGWTLVDHLVDNYSSPKGSFASAPARFVRDSSVADTRLGDYRVVFLHFERGQPG